MAKTGNKPTTYILLKKGIAFFLFLSVFSLSFSSCGSDSKKIYNPITLYFSPTEDYLMSQEHFPNFINYPNDRVKLGYRGDVKEVKYNTLHSLAYLFTEDGHLQGRIFTASGGRTKEIKVSTYVYNEKGDLMQIVEENLLDQGKGARSAREKEIDRITAYTASGKPLVREIDELNRKRVDHIVQYEYDENDICRGVRLTEDSPNKKADAMAFTFTCDEKGLITYIQAKRTRIPYRFTQGVRKITPSYDANGRLVSIKEMAIPGNMEAYRIDSIASETHYTYNKQGDIITCTYSDIVHPSNETTDFTLAFTYEYDQHGNWIKKHIIGEIEAVNASMNTYYKDNYAINRITGEDGKNLGEIVLEREITYYEKEQAAKEKKQKKAKKIKIDIPKTTGMLGSEAYSSICDKMFSGKTISFMSAADRKKYKIEESCISEEHVVYGKLIHRADGWRVESILGIQPDHRSIEYLVFYDDNGQLIGCIEIGDHMYYAGDMTESEIEGNILRTKTEWWEPGSGGGAVFVEYEITPEFTLNEIKRSEERYEETYEDIY